MVYSTKNEFLNFYIIPVLSENSRVLNTFNRFLNIFM